MEISSPAPQPLQKSKSFFTKVWTRERKEQQNTFIITLALFQIFLIILFATVGGSSELPAGSPGTGTQGYNMFIGVEIMM